MVCVCVCVCQFSVRWGEREKIARVNTERSQAGSIQHFGLGKGGGQARSPTGSACFYCFLCLADRTFRPLEPRDANKVTQYGVGTAGLVVVCVVTQPLKWGTGRDERSPARSNSRFQKAMFSPDPFFPASSHTVALAPSLASGGRVSAVPRWLPCGAVRIN